MFDFFDFIFDFYIALTKTPIHTVLFLTWVVFDEDANTNLSNLLFFLLLDRVSESIVITFYDDKIVTLGVDDKFPRRVP